MQPGIQPLTYGKTFSTVVCSSTLLPLAQHFRGQRDAKTNRRSGLVRRHSSRGRLWKRHREQFNEQHDYDNGPNSRTNELAHTGDDRRTGSPTQEYQHQQQHRAGNQAADLT
jgi:hypothetical protein